jgi:RNA polymerase sigma factor (TIGR02999 family)
VSNRCRDINVTTDLLPELYDQLRILADQWFNDQPPDHTLQPTALVHEAYLRLAAQPDSEWTSRTHFYAGAARAMRHVLIDYARRRAASKRGAAWCRIALADADEMATTGLDLQALCDALEKLEQLNSRQCRIVELRFLGGLSVRETAEALDVSERTIKLDWRMARAWLIGELRERIP